MIDELPSPLTMGSLCGDCGGTGADRQETLRLRRSGSIDRGSYVSCWAGNGLAPSAYFRWSRNIAAGDSVRGALQIG